MSKLRTSWAALQARTTHGRGLKVAWVLAPVALGTSVFGVAAAATWTSHPHPVVRHSSAVARPASDSQPAVPAGVNQLSAGAPAGALTFTAEPAMVSNPVPGTPAVVSALAANGIPQVALNAYRVAAARIDQALVNCRIDWSLIAAIGRVESDHGRFAGATLQADGTSAPPIIGPALDGHGFAFIGDTDQGRYDGDLTYDRAVGPMQFIPSTWASYSVDGNADGTASPLDINDAALGAAHYLCIAGGDLSTEAGKARAVLAYNHSDAYVAEVLALARGYANGTQVDAPLVGTTTGPVAAPTGNFQAPAAPGPARASAPSGSTARPRPAATRSPAATQTAPRPGAPAPVAKAPVPSAPKPAATAVPSAPRPAAPAPAPVPALTSPTPIPTVAPLPVVQPLPVSPSPSCLLPPVCLAP